jgi:hypothetical protein
MRAQILSKATGLVAGGGDCNWQYRSFRWVRELCAVSRLEHREGQTMLTRPKIKPFQPSLCDAQTKIAKLT